jgi:hypothetical protein
MKPRVLIACEFSGIVRDAFTKMGADAWSCDLLPTERPGNHYQCDVRDILNNGWDLMIAHPPCTYLSNAGACHLYPKGKLNKNRYYKGLKAKDFFMELYTVNINKICIENPVASLIYNLPKYTQIIQPFQYGHRVSKRTCLWLKNLPNLLPTKIIHDPESTRIAGNWYNKGGKDRQKNRSKTFQGIADAMAEQWYPLLTSPE